MKQVIDRLREESKKSPVLTAVLVYFGSRKRARGTLSAQVLQRSMAREGFTYSHNDYAKVLELLASLGLGKINRDSRGRIKGLKEVTVTFQSIGKAVIDEAERPLAIFNKRERYSKVLTLMSGIAPAKSPMPKTVRVKIGKKTLPIEVPNDFDVQDIIELFSKFQ